MIDEEFNYQCPSCDSSLFWDDTLELNRIALVLLCKKCNKHWEIDEVYDPESNEEHFYIVPFEHAK